METHHLVFDASSDPRLSPPTPLAETDIAPVLDVMLPLIKSDTLDDPEFEWGKKRRLGGKKKDVQFYESFTYDGVNYSLYDCVYMYKHGEPAPYIGKLIKMWETAERNNKIKVQWFFRPSEISYYLKDEKVLENELFFASGDGIGLADLNPLEAIAGKCNVVCTSKDRRNPQPSAEELQMADYVFYRIFDVKSCTISDQIDDKVGGLDVNFVFNRREGILDSGEKYEARNVVACEETLSVSGCSSLPQFNDNKLDEHCKNALEGDTNVTQVTVNQGSLVGKHSSGVDVISSRNREISGTPSEERNTMGAKNMERNTSEKKHKSKDIQSPVSLVEAEKGMKKYARKSCDLDDAPSKRTKIDGSVSPDSNVVPGLSVPRNDAANLSTGANTSKVQLKSGPVKDSVGCRKDMKLADDSSPLDEKLSKTGSSLSKDVSRSGHAEDSVRIQKTSKSNGILNALSKAKELSSAEKENLGSAHRKDSFVAVNDEKLGENLSSPENSSEIIAVSRVEIHRPSKTNVLPSQIQKSVPSKEFERPEPFVKPVNSLSTSMKRPGEINALETKEKSNLGRDKSHDNNERSRKAAKPPQSLSTTMKRTVEVSAQECKERSNLGHDKSLEKEQKLVGDSCPKDKGYPKKAKLDDSIKLLEVNKNNKTKNLKVNTSLGETKNSPKYATSSDNNVKSRLDEGPSNEYHDVKEKINVCGTNKNTPKFMSREDKEKLRLGEGLSNMHRNKKDGKLLIDNLPNSFASKCKDDGGKVGGKIIEVTPKPPHKPTWMKLSWDEQMKTAHDQGRLVLLQNLDPEYTSGEVEDIIWHTFGEHCYARMVPHTAISNRFSGQAFVVFKTSGVASQVVQKLNDECLMLPNQRPLVACYGVLPKPSEKKVFVGHLAIDKGWRQTQRDVKEAVSTSHYSQHNTIEYTMAMDWCLLQLQSDKWWKDLHELQRKELKKLGDDLQPK